MCVTNAGLSAVKNATTCSGRYTSVWLVVARVRSSRLDVDRLLHHLPERVVDHAGGVVAGDLQHELLERPHRGFGLRAELAVDHTGIEREVGQALLHRRDVAAARPASERLLQMGRRRGGGRGRGGRGGGGRGRGRVGRRRSVAAGRVAVALQAAHHGHGGGAGGHHTDRGDRRQQPPPRECVLAVGPRHGAHGPRRARFVGVDRGVEGRRGVGETSLEIIDRLAHRGRRSSRSSTSRRRFRPRWT